MKIGFIGTGNMGMAIIKGFISANTNAAENIYAFDRDDDKLNALTKELGIQPCGSIGQLVEVSDIVVIAVKPNIYDIALPEIDAAYQSNKIVVSIAAGISIGFIEKNIKNEKAKIVRVMPNIPAMVNESMTAVCRNSNLTDAEFDSVFHIFTSIGKAEVVDEKLIDAVIGVSGSSSAYTYMFIEALIDGAVINGMKKDQATIFAAQSVLGAAKMVLETGINPVNLRENVCSPGGTTIEAVKVLQNNGFCDNVIEAVNAAVEKSKIMTK